MTMTMANNGRKTAKKMIVNCDRNVFIALFPCFVLQTLQKSQIYVNRSKMQHRGVEMIGFSPSTKLKKTID